MKASESNSHYASKVRECTNFAVREIKKVCQNVGPRPSGEEGEKKAQDYIENLMTPIADEVKREEFSLSPKAFMGWMLVDGIMMLVSAALMIIALTGLVPGAAVFKAVATVLSVLSLIFLLGEFLFYKKLLDPLFPKKESSNVICTRKAAGETKRRIIVGGHIDSAYEWRYTHLGGSKLLTAVVIIAVVSLLCSLVIDVVSFFDLGRVADFSLLAAQCVTVPGFVLILFFVNGKVCVMGANDNLTGVFTSMAVIKYLKDNDIRFENTEVVAVSTGSEESGLRGAKAFAASHAKEYAESGVETVFLAVDTLHDFDHFGVFNKDMTGTVKLSTQAALMVKTAGEIAGYDLPYKAASVGATDAAATQQGGIKSAALVAMDPAPAKYYHTREDTADILDFKTVESGLKIALESVFLFDEQGLKDNYS
ncbi:MAG: M20/M25/M40 family metallo-hydrolase [Oscillospiraceae bacterium]|nr:M20/M25/M40 family metallo-hydrolase [Oscillospiraceae bacterium]